MLTFGWGKPARANVQTQSNGSARPFPPTRDAAVGIKIIQRAFRPSELLGGTCLRAVPVFSKRLAVPLVFLRERGKRGCKGVPRCSARLSCPRPPNPPSFPGNQPGKAGSSHVFQKMELKSLPCEIVTGLSAVPGEYRG